MYDAKIFWKDGADEVVLLEDLFDDMISFGVTFAVALEVTLSWKFTFGSFDGSSSRAETGT